VENKMATFNGKFVSDFREFRKGLLNAKDCARILCGAIDHGVTQSDIEEAATQRGCWTPTTKDCERRKRQAKAAMQLMTEQNNLTLAAADTVLIALQGSLQTLLDFIARLPAIGKPLGIPVARAVRNVGGIRTLIQVRRAANDELYRQVANL
jgi:hypothetical protein